MSATTELSSRIMVCDYEHLTADLGVAAYVDGVQVALFRLADGSLHAVQNLCPFSGAHVISRGITGSRAGEPTIASPIYKQVFSLVTGACVVDMDKEPLVGVSADLEVYPVTHDNGSVFIDVAGTK